MIDVAAEHGWWQTCYSIMKTIQSILQGRWHDDNSLMQLPHINSFEIAARVEKKMRSKGLRNLVRQYNKQKKNVSLALSQEFGEATSRDILYALSRMPNISVSSKFCTEEKNYIEVSVVRNGQVGKRGVPKALTPCFPKLKEESWWCAVVDETKLISLKRFSLAAKATFKIHLDESADLMRLLHAERMPDIFLVCDSYIGMDECVRVSQSTHSK